MERLNVLKTYKIYIGGQFPRTESGRYYKLENKKGKLLANLCLSSRKDLRNAVVAARNAQAGWAAKSAMNRGQILYRIAETMEGRKEQLEQELIQIGIASGQAAVQVREAIDRTVYYAGWCDKYQALFGSVNPVASSHFNFSSPEPMGVCGIIQDDEGGLLSIIQLLMPAIAGGNSVVFLAAERAGAVAVTLAEIIHASDVSAGVVNILTGKKDELLNHFGSHMDINAVVLSGKDQQSYKTLGELASLNVKRLFRYIDPASISATEAGPYPLMDLQEVKTTWHPVENIGGSKASY